jgi:hypothetical protein
MLLFIGITMSQSQKPTATFPTGKPVVPPASAMMHKEAFANESIYKEKDKCLQ